MPVFFTVTLYSLVLDIVDKDDPKQVKFVSFFWFRILQYTFVCMTLNLLLIDWFIEQIC